MKQKAFVAQRGRCARCARSLPPTWHLHHRRSKREGGTDELANVRALCEECHAAEHGGVIGGRPAGR